VNDPLRRALLRAEPASDRFLRFADPVGSRVAAVPDEVPALLDFAERGAASGLWAVGFVGYEAAPAFDSALAAHAPASGPAPLAAFALFREPGELLLTGARRERTEAPTREVRAGIEEGSFTAGVEAIRAAIAAGSTYQVNLSFPFNGRLSPPSRTGESGLSGFLAPEEAPYAAWLEGESWAILSLSPELFFERAGARVVSRPMKGTRRRGRFPAEDARRAAELAASEKDRAENLMIVDMVRNDLGRIARPGSVEVERALELERFPTVWQMTSTVAATSDARLPELFAALFPCASVTGAPKPATTRFIRDLEAGPRGVYCGAIGSVRPGGRARFSVAIRTLEIDLRDARFRYGVGCGVTWDSDPREEWRECLAKARVLDGPGPDFELIETMRWREGIGVELLDLHVERIAGSAGYFGFAGVDALGARMREAIAAHGAALPSGSHRLRLKLARDGEIAIESEPFEAETKVWTIAIAAEPSSSEDLFAFHKTTRRERYERALAEAPPGVDEVLLVNEHGELTEGTRTNLMVQMSGDVWLTPPVESGLLPGVFREHLLRTGQAIEATLYPRDLKRAHRIRLVNALRGWIPARTVL
jgi:para-aminobenzoate synthetase/4-amino-4-deoxychorismate lyase